MKAIVTGISGQDGSFMCEFLLNQGIEVYGFYRHKAKDNLDNLSDSVLTNKNFHLVSGDITDSFSVSTLVKTVKPDYFFNFAANSFVGVSWSTPAQVFQTNTIGVINCLEAIREYAPSCRFLNMGSSEEFGDVQYSPQDENHPLRPRSPYGASKASARHVVKVYRESYNLFAVQPWCFNHEGTRRGLNFVTRKISRGVANIYFGKQGRIVLGNLSAKRDWSDAEDIIEALWLIINNDKPKDYVISSNETHTISEFIVEAFKVAFPCRYLKFSIDDSGFGKYILDSQQVIEVSKEFYRPAEVDLLLGNSRLLREELGWKPKTSFNQLVEKMVRNDMFIVKNEQV